MGGFTTCATHDYLARNRVRWQALNDLVTEDGISPSSISGGFEFNGWYLGNRLETCSPDWQGLTAANSGWTAFTCLWDTEANNASGAYEVAFAPQKGFTVEKTYPFQRWLPWQKGSLYVLRRL